MNKKILIATSAIIIAGGAGLSYFGGFSGLQSSFFGETLSIVDEPVCGNGILEAKEDNSVVEQCDDGNTDNWDNCSSFCQLEQGGGCLDVSAENYDPNAVYDNKSCDYPVPEKAWTYLQKQTITVPMTSNRGDTITLYSGYENIPTEDITDGFIKEISSRYYLYMPYLLNKLESESKVFEKKIQELNTGSALKVFSAQIYSQKSKIDDAVRSQLDLYVCTKNKAYKEKNYAYASLSALDEKKIALEVSLAKTGNESLRVKLTTLQAELKKIPTRNTAERRAKSAEISATNLAITNAQAELTALTSKANITKCIQPAQVAITQAEAEIQKIQSSPGYIKIEQEISANKLQIEELEKLAKSVNNEAQIVYDLFGSKITDPTKNGGGDGGEDGTGDGDGNQKTGICCLCAYGNVDDAGKTTFDNTCDERMNELKCTDKNKRFVNSLDSEMTVLGEFPRVCPADKYEKVHFIEATHGSNNMEAVICNAIPKIILAEYTENEGGLPKDIGVTHSLCNGINEYNAALQAAENLRKTLSSDPSLRDIKITITGNQNNTGVNGYGGDSGVCAARAQFHVCSSYVKVSLEVCPTIGSECMHGSESDSNLTVQCSTEDGRMSSRTCVFSHRNEYDVPFGTWQY